MIAEQSHTHAVEHPNRKVLSSSTPKMITANVMLHFTQKPENFTGNRAFQASRATH